MTKSQVDKLGERLKVGNYSDEDVRLLDEYRESFTTSYHSVIRIVLEHVNIEPTGRRIKSTQSIIGKLQRQSTKLSQIQDIAGCRITVEDINQQNNAAEKIVGAFPGAIVIDRRERPSHGYRAIHIIAGSQRRVEIQIRTRLQHLWAQLSEKLSDVIDPMIKYGAGPLNSKNMLLESAIIISHSEAIEQELYRKGHNAPDIELVREDLRKLKDRIKEKLTDEIRLLELKEKP